MASSHSFVRFHELDLESQYAVDRLCTRFENALLAGAEPRLEDYLGEFSTAAQPVALAELLVHELEFRQGRGEQPSERAYADRFRAHADVVVEVFSSMKRGFHMPGEAEQASGSRALGALPEVDRYELIEELGRGGMGVVYKALHRTLRRVVALKMILAGDFAAEHHRERFLDEGALLARMRHPNIVQVFDVGHHEGRPFLALEYVDGGTLAERQKDRPLTPGESAWLVEQLARAIHYAHQRGVIHRDLKPANILLDQSAVEELDREGPGAEPGALPLVPKITDFGLARSAEHSRGLTISGIVMGTPSYLSPEQARGERHLGPSTDIYALGAILYDLLARRPPFRADTPLETVHMVLEQEPTRPSRWLAGVPGDLETVCLRCLEKDPAKRYATAEALADDLHRWRHGGRIVARPLRALERGWKWCRKRPALAASLLAAGTLAVAVTVVSTVSAIRLRHERNAVVAESERARRSEQQRRIALVDALFTTAPANVPFMLETLGSSSALVLPTLRERFQGAPAGTHDRLRGAIALTVLGEPQDDELIGFIRTAHPAESGNLALAFRTVGGDDVAEAILRSSGDTEDPIHRARCAILLLDLGDTRGVQPLVAHSPDPTLRSILIDEVHAWHGDFSALPRLLRETSDPDCLSGLCAVSGRVDPATLSAETRSALADALTELHGAARDAGTHSTSRWALQQWGLAVPPGPVSGGPREGYHWFTNRSELTMVELQAGGYIPQPPTVILLTQPFYMSDQEIPIALFRRFLDDPGFPEAEKPRNWPGPIRETSPQEDCPVNNVLHAEIIPFCNWLSDRDGRRRCYSQGRNPNTWNCDFGANGYRLPTEAEWSYAHRAGATTIFFFGNDPRWLSTYAHTSALQTVPGGSKLPNRWGLFDMVGNVWELTSDYFGPLPPMLLVNPTGPPAGTHWLAHGGAFDSGSFNTQSSQRTPTDNAGNSLGFRVVCRDSAESKDHDMAIRAALDQAIQQFSGMPLLLQYRASLKRSDEQ